MPEEEHFPFAQRNDTMYLQTFEKARETPKYKGAGILPSSLMTGDVEGATPKIRHRSLNKPKDTSLHVHDIFGTRPKNPHPDLNKPKNRILSNDDIELSKPAKKSEGFHSNRHTNPIVPDYKLPSSAPVEPYEPKFLGDRYNVTDIEGTSPAPLFRFKTRHGNMKCDDIEGAKPKSHFDKPARNHLDVSDILDTHFATSRVTNVMSPRYRYDVPDFIKYGSRPSTAPLEWEIGKIEGSHPKHLPPQHEGPFYPLFTDDITGATPAGGMADPLPIPRRQYRNTNFVGDIWGAQADTHCDFKNQGRVTNPLNPQYQPLDGNDNWSARPRPMDTHSAEKASPLPSDHGSSSSRRPHSSASARRPSSKGSNKPATPQAGSIPPRPHTSQSSGSRSSQVSISKFVQRQKQSLPSQMVPSAASPVPSLRDAIDSIRSYSRVPTPASGSRPNSGGSGRNSAGRPPSRGSRPPSQQSERGVVMSMEGGIVQRKVTPTTTPPLPSGSIGRPRSSSSNGSLPIPSGVEASPPGSVRSSSRGAPQNVTFKPSPSPRPGTPSDAKIRQAREAEELADEIASIRSLS